MDLDRFVDAQAGTYDRALAELRAGRKTSHWMWWIFPQVAGLGMSSTSAAYAVADLAEARAYLDHPVLGPRLLECCRALLALEGVSAERVLGSVDAMKLRSSMTLFMHADPAEGTFREVLDRYYDGAEDERTVALLA
ncbi:DUF1810 domain-containing protein [Nocardioides glacieisoli]|uniref:DUF1810 domain-containing protein n=1 Tax=Nocardioides glacieisoli TaxID=1168730 RepID=A0A4Q2RL45_9ACTN|nr:DUF1810 domain-containing protein [Nocardioides glacieisoli]RYB89417.1 DUF1810 domain-containing protein [Nocardioides glacieisoli]